MSEPDVQRTVGVGGVVVTVVGLVIGISIFILPGALAATAGPAVVVSYAIAGLMALFSCVVAAQIGVVFPTSGASFVAVNRIVSPAAGFAAMWLMIGGAAVAIALVAYGFADYALLLLPGLDRFASALLVVAVLTILNLLGVRQTVIGQGVMVVVFLVALGVFCTAALVALDPDLLTPFMPRGLGPVLAAAVPAFFSFAGFTVIIDIGGEVEEPGRTLPIALASSFLLVLVAYLAVSLSIVGVVPWQELEGVGAPVGETARRILPTWTLGGITVAVLAAAATSINALLLGFSRDVLALARVRAFPGAFAAVSPRHGEPTRGVLLVAGLAVIAIASGGTITGLATLVVVALLVLQAALGLTAVLLPLRVPELYRRAGFRLGRVALTFFGAGLIALSVSFLVVAAWGNLPVVMVGGGWLLLGLVYFALRRASLRRRGVELEELMRGARSAP